MEEAIITKIMHDNNNNSIGLSITDIVKLTHLSRSIIRTCLARMEGANKVKVRKVGMAKVYILNQQISETGAEARKPIENKTLIYVLGILIITSIILINAQITVASEESHIIVAPPILIEQYDTGNQINYPATIAQGYVYIGDNTGTIYKFDASNISQPVSTINLDSAITASLAVSDSYIYVPCQNGYVYQLDVSDLAIVSNFSTGILNEGQPEEFFSTPAISGGYIYIGNDNGTVYQLSATDISQEIANYTTSDMIRSSPAVSGGYVYVGSNDGKLYQLSATDISQEIANHTAANDGNVSSPTAANGYVYFGKGSILYQLSATDISQEIASYSIDNMITSGPYNITTAPIFFDGYIYIGNKETYIYQLNATDISDENGGLIDIYNNRLSSSNIALANGYVYTISEGVLFRLEATSIHRIIGSAFYYEGNGIAASNNNIYVNGNNGVIYQFYAQCVERWVQNTVCTSEEEKIEYIDINSCGTANNLPADNGTYCDLTPPTVSFCGGLEDFGITDVPYEGRIYTANQIPVPAACSQELNFKNLSFEIVGTSFYVSSSSQDIKLDEFTPSIYYWYGLINEADEQNAFNTDGMYILKVTSYDKSYNYAEKNITVYRDTLPPEGSSAITEGMFSDAAVDLSTQCVDTGTGVNYTELVIYSISSGGSLVTSRSVESGTISGTQTLGDSQYYMTYTCSDRAGHTYISPDINFTVDTVSPIVSFCEGYNYSEIPYYPYDGALYNENSLIPQVGCVEDTNFKTLYWGIPDIGYQISYTADNAEVFQNPLNGNNVYYTNDEISAPDIFSSGSGKYILDVTGIDAAGHTVESNKTVYYDDAAPNIYFCDNFGGASPEDEWYVTSNSNFWIDLCVYDYTWNNMTGYLRNENNNTILEAYGAWSGGDCVYPECGFAREFNLTEYNISDGVYHIYTEATDLAGHTGFGEVRSFYYDTTPPIFLGSNVVNNSVLVSLNESISFQFDDRTFGSMVARLYHSNGTYISQTPIGDCAYEGINTTDGYAENFINSAGINCSISLLDLGISPNDTYIINVQYTDGVNLSGQSDAITFEMNCMENWVSDPLTCIEGTQVVSYTDTHRCGTTALLPEDNGTTIESNRCYYSNNTVINDCGNIAESGTYSLNASIGALNNSLNCLIIQSDNVTVDCLGRNITGDIRGDSFTEITLNNCVINGSINAIGRNGGMENHAAENGGTIIIYNSTIINMTVTGGRGYSEGRGGNGGEVTAYNSTIINIKARGGDGGWEGIGGAGGNITAYDSEITTITTTGGRGYRHFGGQGGAVTAYNSEITTITTTGGDTQYGGLGGQGGQVIIASSSITPLANITTTGEEQDGTVIIMDSKIDWNSTINIGNGRLILNQSYFDNIFGEIKFDYLNTSQTEFSSIISIQNDSAHIDSTRYTEYNVPSEITLNIAGWNIVNPVIKRDDMVCSDCTVLNYSSDAISFDVNGWSTYTVAENIPSPLLGSSGGSTDGPTGGGKGGGGQMLCTANWTCNKWTVCSEHGIRIRTCADSNSCGTLDSKPDVTQICDMTAYKMNNASQRKALFDIIVDVVSEPANSGDDLVVKVSLINFGTSSQINANLNYNISDSNGNTVRQFSQVIPVVTQTEFLQNINTSGLDDGKYTLSVELKYDKQKDPANAEKIFYIGNIAFINSLFRNTGVGTVLLSIALVALLVFLYIKTTRNVLDKKIERHTQKDGAFSSNQSSNASENVNVNALKANANSDSKTEKEAYNDALNNIKEVAHHDIKPAYNTNEYENKNHVREARAEEKNKKRPISIKKTKVEKMKNNILKTATNIRKNKPNKKEIR